MRAPNVHLLEIPGGNSHELRASRIGGTSVRHQDGNISVRKPVGRLASNFREILSIRLNPSVEIGPGPIAFAKTAAFAIVPA